ncbi:hypothetical protein CVT26_003689 [Gymnopilus dilepis]|uniref:Chromosome segregation in meiosis protein n=1 Tax=Gymnopilus dilepis TaxID=231916 RepID=A0A409W264_9AGAR|nr:hypothetical protein CVT26_003689 [Gymnopilus dilepis]
MDSSLDSIWDQPAIEDDGEQNVSRPSKRPRQALFLADSDDDIEMSSVQPTHKAPPPQEVDIDALFDDFDKEMDDDGPYKRLAVPVDEAELVRQAEAQVRKTMPALTPHQILPSSSPSRDAGGTAGNRQSGNKGKDKDKDEKKATRRMMKLDENLLVSPLGFPKLIKMTKDFRIKGKGHEATDLNRLLQTYQYWTHQLYPKTPFRDTVERIEKLCHSKRMNVSLSVWRDEAHGRPTTQNHDSDEEDSDGGQANDDEANAEDRGTGPRSSPSRSQSRASSTRPENESETVARPPNQSSTGTATTPSEGREEDEEESFWRSMDEFSGHSSDPPAAPTTAANSSADEDEEMWNIIDEVENASGDNPSLPVAAPAPQPPTQQEEPPDDWDDMYL